MKWTFPIVLVLAVSVVHGQDDSIGIGWIHISETQYVEYPKAIRSTNDTGLLVLISQFSVNLSRNVTKISRIAADGQETWSKCLNVDGGERPNDLECLENGDFVVTGDNWTSAFDSSGNVLWFLDHFRDARGIGNDIEVCKDHIFVTGTKQDSVFLIKISHDGILEFQHTYPTYEHSWMEGKAVSILDTSTMVLCAEVFDVEMDFVYSRVGLFFLDTSGVVQTFKIYKCDLPECYSIACPPNDLKVYSNRLYVLGTTYVTGGFVRPYLTQINSSYDKAWETTYDDGSLFSFSEVYDLFIDEMGNNLICGACESADASQHDTDFWVLRCSPSGTLLWDFKYGTSYWERATTIAQVDTDCYVFAGYSTRRNSLGGNTSYVIKIGKGLHIIPARGDVNGDGIIDVSDVMEIVSHLIRSNVLPEDQFERADCNGDGMINVLDIVGVVNVILGIGEYQP